MDIESSFLYEDVKKKINMSLPEDSQDKSKTLWLNKFMYGLNNPAGSSMSDWHSTWSVTDLLPPILNTMY
jgi:hypothetical protein